VAVPIHKSPWESSQRRLDSLVGSKRKSGSAAGSPSRRNALDRTEAKPTKQRRKQMKRFDQLAVVALTLGLPLSSLAVDSVILIDQNKAMADNVTPGDTPGFPVSIIVTVLSVETEMARQKKG
jgi:hypothetical protein